MSLSSATNVTQSALSTVAAQINVVSQNIAGANTTGYAEQTANVASTQNGGVKLTSVVNTQNKALFESVLGATSSSAQQQAISNGLSTLQQTIGDTSSTTSPSAQIMALVNALQQYASQPSNASLATSTITAASSMATTLNNATNSVQQLREQADSQMAASVDSINSLLTQFKAVNSQVVSGTALGQNVNTLLGTRNSILTQLSQQIGISTVAGVNNDMSIYTDSGVTLFQGGQASSVTFQPTATYTASVTGNAVFIDGMPVTGASAVMPIQSGALAGLGTLRDNIAVTYQTQLDQTAQGLIDSFAETDPSGSGTTLAGLFTNGGSTAIPAPGSNAGLAGTIAINAAVDPNQGGNPQLVGNGINYNFNTSNDASFGGQLQQLLTNLSSNQTYNAAGQIGTSATVSNYSIASASWLNAQIQNANSEGSYQSTLLSSSTTALSNATGVNLDNEMSKMLDLENAYSATAKLLTTINNMFSALTASINPVAVG